MKFLDLRDGYNAIDVHIDGQEIPIFHYQTISSFLFSFVCVYVCVC